MIGDEFHENSWDRQGSSGGLRLGWAEGRATSGTPGDLFGDRDGRSVEVDSTNPETGAFTPLQPEHGPEMDYQPKLWSERLSKIRQIASCDQRALSERPDLKSASQVAHRTLSNPHALATSCRMSTYRQVRQ